jgi:alanine racemase
MPKQVLDRLRSTLSGRDLAEYLLVSPALVQGDSSLYRGAWRFVDLGAIARNYTLVSSATHRAVIAVVKARAYGAGMVPVAEKLRREGCGAFGVATLGAAIALREAFDLEKTTPAGRPTILVLGFVPPVALELARDFGISLNITDPSVWPQYARALDSLKPGKGRQTSFHLELDTGMGRTGVPATGRHFNRALALANEIRHCPRADLEGIFSHFPVADRIRVKGSPDEQTTLNQISTMKTVLDALAEEGITPRMVHLANSPAIEQYPEAFTPDWVTHVRTGSLLHGVSLVNPEKYCRASRWEAALVRVERTNEAMGISYGCTYRAWRGQHIGTIAIGYADGYLPAQPGQTNWVRLDGIALPVVGAVCMDMCMVDLEPYVERKGRPPRPGDVVELLSSHTSGDLLSMESLAARWGVSCGVVLTGIQTRDTLVYEGAPSARPPKSVGGH